MKQLFTVLMLLVLFAITASAAITEIRKDFLNQTSLLSATPFISAPGATANYLVCVYLDQPGSENSMSAVLRWTDENALPQSFMFSAPSGPVNSCNPIRNHAGTTPTIETDGAYPGTYELFVTGFGFWTTGPQGQGGITEPIARHFLKAFDGTLLTPAATGDYLIAVSASTSWTLGWTDFQGPQSVSGGPSNNGYTLPIHVLGGTEITFSGGGINEPVYIYAVHFGTPSTGTGRLTDYETNLLNYTNVKWPYYVNVLTSTSPGMYVFAGNIARVPNGGGPAELAFWGDDLFLQILDVEPEGAPGKNGFFPAPVGIVGAGYRNGSAAEPFTFNVTTAINRGNGVLGWGSVPNYSAEIDVIRF
ncbi:MAG: hypothetical protein WA172_10160 [Terriglobales bacterium]